MKTTTSQPAQPENPFVGTWHIYEMELWDEDYFNMETQAYIEISPNHLGEFQFGLVSDSLDGNVEPLGETERLTFTWSGQDEMDPASGSGWLQLTGEDEAEGLIKLHLGDCSLFKAKKVS